MQNLKLKKSGAGFTLIELLVVIVVVIAIGMFVVSILISTLRGTNKTNALTVVRQNGNNAISQMSKTIRNAKSLNDPASCVSPPVLTPTLGPSDHISFTGQDGQIMTYACCMSTTGDSSTLISINEKFTGGSCSSAQQSSLLDKTSVTLTNDCSFTCSQNSNIVSPSVKINFTLRSYTAGVGVLLQENSAIIPFQTSVVLRNLAR